MAEAIAPRVGVVGVPGQWSTEARADALAADTGHRLVIDMAGVALQPGIPRLTFEGLDLCALDGLVVKKVGQSYSPATLDRLELLRVAEAAGVRVFSPPASILRLVDRLSCTVTLLNAGIPMPDTCVTEDAEIALTGFSQCTDGRYRMTLADSKQRQALRVAALGVTGGFHVRLNDGQVFRDSNHVLVCLSRYTRLRLLPGYGKSGCYLRKLNGRRRRPAFVVHSQEQRV